MSVYTSWGPALLAWSLPTAMKQWLLGDMQTWIFSYLLIVPKFDILTQINWLLVQHPPVLPSSFPSALMINETHFADSFPFRCFYLLPDYVVTLMFGNEDNLYGLNDTFQIMTIDMVEGQGYACCRQTAISSFIHSTNIR